MRGGAAHGCVGIAVAGGRKATVPAGMIDLSRCRRRDGLELWRRDGPGSRPVEVAVDIVLGQDPAARTIRPARLSMRRLLVRRLVGWHIASCNPPHHSRQQATRIACRMLLPGSAIPDVCSRPWSRTTADSDSRSFTWRWSRAEGVGNPLAAPRTGQTRTAVCPCPVQHHFCMVARAGRRVDLNARVETSEAASLPELTVRTRGRPVG
jgi:hypothetical protein